ncbi:MAG: hypothetical protein JWP89_2723 [Schlesneria sp.]|nr:hypothetical protein [Schlesneria sp.]
MHEPLMDEERIAGLVDELVSVLVRHLTAAVNQKGYPKVIGPAKLTTEEAAEYVGVTKATLSQWRHHQDERGPKYIQPKRVKGQTLVKGKVTYLRKHLDEWLEKNTVDHSETTAETRARIRRNLGIQ